MERERERRRERGRNRNRRGKRETEREREKESRQRGRDMQRERVGERKWDIERRLYGGFNFSFVFLPHHKYQHRLLSSS